MVYDSHSRIVQKFEAYFTQAMRQPPHTAEEFFMQQEILQKYSEYVPG